MDLQYISNAISKKKRNAIVAKEVELTIANLYRGDMEGLLRKHLHVPSNLIHHTITLNGFDSSSDYNGETKILLLKDSIASVYLKR